MGLAAPLLAWLAHAVLGRHASPVSVPGAAWLLLGAPLLEEAVFRWGLQASLEQALRRAGLERGSLAPTIANLLASIAFVLSHQPSAPILGRVDLLVPSLALGLLWHRHQRYLLCVAMHAWFNLSLVAMTWLA